MGKKSIVEEIQRAEMTRYENPSMPLLIFKLSIMKCEEVRPVHHAIGHPKSNEKAEILPQAPKQNREVLLSITA